MRISEIIASLIPRVRPVGPTRGPIEVEPSPSIYSKPDEVHLSDESQVLSTLLAEIKNLPEVDKAKVEEIKARIEAGEYSPSSKDIAAKILGIENPDR